MAKSEQLDSYDRKILQILATDGRRAWRDLADTIGLSLTPTLRRVRRLEAENYIQGYAALLNERRLLGAVEAMISITLSNQSADSTSSFEAEIGNVEEVTDCFQMTGDYDYLVRAVARDLDHYQTTVTNLARIPMVHRIHSSFILKSVIRRSVQFV
jgi:DNA-binding Lrp family transcriptional regulator